MDEHLDAEQDFGQLQPIITVIQQMLDKMAAMDEEIDSLTKLVNEEIIGGITNLYNSKQRVSGISSLSEKYGDKMGQYKDFYSDLTGGADIYESLYDELDELKKDSEDWGDEKEAARIDELVNELKSRLERMKSHTVGMGEGAAPVGEVSIEVETAAPAEEKSEMEALTEKIRNMKKKSGDVRF